MSASQAAGEPGALALVRRAACDRVSLKGPRAAQWLAAQGMTVPALPNTWAGDEPLVVRLGTGEFFLEDCGTRLRGCIAALEPAPSGVYPVLREDVGFALSGAGTAQVLEQVCNVNLADLPLHSQPVIMTLMIGVAVLVVPQRAGALRRYLIWCDPTFGHYMEVSLGRVVRESGGAFTAATQ